MEKKVISVLKPDIYNDFHCIGDKCRNNCCEYRWRITIDKATYKKYKNIKGDKEFTQKFNSCVKVNKDKTSTNDYALLIQPQDDKLKYKYRCPFQQDNKLCEIVCKYGPDYLCQTCKSYPRVENHVDDNTYIYTIDCSCEEVLRIIGKKNEPIDLVPTEEEISNNKLIQLNNRLTNSITLNKNKLTDEYLYILMICLAIVQNRDYAVDDRLIHLGVYLNKLDEILQSNNISNIKSESEKIIYAIENHLLDDICKTKTNYEVQLQLVIALLNGIYDKEDNPEFFEKAKQNLGNKISINLLKLHKERLNNLQKYMKDNNKDIFWENYLTLIILSSMFPFGEEKFMDSYIVLSTQYVVVKTLLAEYMENDDKISNEDMYDILAYYNKKALHNHVCSEIILKFLDEHNINDLPHILAIMKL